MSIEDLKYFSFLLVLFLYIMALLGMELFANTCRMDADDKLIKDVQAAYLRKDTMIAPRANFDNISSAMTTMFIIILGEDWPGIMYNYVRVYEPNYGWPISMFFMSCFAIGNFILLSLFVAILLSSFENEDEDEEETYGEVDNTQTEDSILEAEKKSLS